MVRKAKRTQSKSEPHQHKTVSSNAELAAKMSPDVTISNPASSKGVSESEADMNKHQHGSTNVSPYTETVYKRVRTLRKKLQRIESYEKKKSEGATLNPDQLHIIENKPILAASLKELEDIIKIFDELDPSERKKQQAKIDAVKDEVLKSQNAVIVDAYTLASGSKKLELYPSIVDSIEDEESHKSLSAFSVHIEYLINPPQETSATEGADITPPTDLGKVARLLRKYSSNSDEKPGINDVVSFDKVKEGVTAVLDSDINAIQESARETEKEDTPTESKPSESPDQVVVAEGEEKDSTQNAVDQQEEKPDLEPSSQDDDDSGAKEMTEDSKKENEEKVYDSIPEAVECSEKPAKAQSEPADNNKPEETNEDSQDNSMNDASNVDFDLKPTEVTKSLNTHIRFMTTSELVNTKAKENVGDTKQGISSEDTTAETETQAKESAGVVQGTSEKATTDGITPTTPATTSSVAAVATGVISGTQAYQPQVAFPEMSSIAPGFPIQQQTPTTATMPQPTGVAQLPYGMLPIPYHLYHHMMYSGMVPSHPGFAGNFQYQMPVPVDSTPTPKSTGNTSVTDNSDPQNAKPSDVGGDTKPKRGQDTQKVAFPEPQDSSTDSQKTNNSISSPPQTQATIPQPNPYMANYLTAQNKMDGGNISTTATAGGSETNSEVGKVGSGNDSTRAFDESSGGNANNPALQDPLAAIKAMKGIANQGPEGFVSLAGVIKPQFIYQQDPHGLGAHTITMPIPADHGHGNIGGKNAQAHSAPISRHDSVNEAIAKATAGVGGGGSGTGNNNNNTTGSRSISSSKQQQQNQDRRVAPGGFAAQMSGAPIPAPNNSGAVGRSTSSTPSSATKWGVPQNYRGQDQPFASGGMMVQNTRGIVGQGQQPGGPHDPSVYSNIGNEGFVLNNAQQGQQQQQAARPGFVVDQYHQYYASGAQPNIQYPPVQFP
ncbi:hypothetical protein H4219_005996 [Mycoemilia scoparia]|uniref:Uncharacterized protein n=1 Tax=Mycoemilia scoparia TaxID=417184 RepID=A0A9W7ZQX3_9FUNG|nr:hypothetical protein H4219_005996 [Mycoemilia scoparia]